MRWWSLEEGQPEVGEYGGEGVPRRLRALRRRSLRHRPQRSWRETRGRALLAGELGLWRKLRWRLGRGEGQIWDFLGHDRSHWFIQLETLSDMKGTGISEIALPQTFSGLLHRVNTAIEITTMIVAIERIVSNAIATTFALATVFLSGGEGAPLRVLRSAGLCKGAPLKVLSLGRAVDQDRAPTNDRSISTLHHQVVPGQTDQIGGEIRDKCGGLGI